jgi:hypothetical protein
MRTCPELCIYEIWQLLLCAENADVALFVSHCKHMAVSSFLQEEE